MKSSPPPADDLNPLTITEHTKGARLHIQVKPKASKTAILGTTDGTLRIALAAPPTDGLANDALTKALAKWLGLPPSTITIQTGQRSKHKLIQFTGLSAEQLQRRLAPHLPQSDKP